jgi:hypothetical protein
MDITMCEGNNCDLAKTCLRHVGQPNEYRQAYFTDNPNKSNTECDYYLKIKENERDNTDKVPH